MNYRIKETQYKNGISKFTIENDDDGIWNGLQLRHFYGSYNGNVRLSKSDLDKIFGHSDLEQHIHRSSDAAEFDSLEETKIALVIFLTNITKDKKEIYHNFSLEQELREMKLESIL